MKKYGAEIDTAGGKPDWLRADEWDCMARMNNGLVQIPGDSTMPDTNDWVWSQIVAIGLPVDHPYYLATSKGFTYWPGGKIAPDDWTGNPDDIIYRDGIIGQGMGRLPFVWTHFGNPADIIGYKRKADSFEAAFRTDLAEIPAWAIARVKELYVDKEGMAASFARYIMSKEEPPVDPDLIEARQIACGIVTTDTLIILEGRADDAWTVQAALEGIKLGRARERGE